MIQSLDEHRITGYIVKGMKILFVRTKFLCYESNAVFFDEMEEELKKLGCEVITCDVMDEKTGQEEFPKLIGASFDAIIDFNSVLPLAQMEDGTPLIDKIDAPFFNYIVDHPMFHHKSLQVPLKNYHLICIDRNHVTYARECYPHMKSVTFLPLAAMKALIPVKFEQKNTSILFSGTYMPSQEHYDKIMEFPQEHKKDTLAVIDRLLADHSKPLEMILKEYYAEKGIELVGKELRDTMLTYYRADYFVRTYYRENLIDGLLKEGLYLEVLGCDWENFRTKYEKNLKIRQGVGYALNLQMIAKAKVLLSVQPLFKDGIHDRVFSAMANHTVAVSDTSTYMEEEFTDGEDMLLYQQGNITMLAQRLTDCLEHPEKMMDIAESGYRKAMERHTWEVRMKQFVAQLQKLKRA